MKSTITIIGKRWFDKVNGNTYHSTRVHFNGKEIGYVPFEYGYGNHWEWTGLELLKKFKKQFEKYSCLWNLQKKYNLVTSVSDGLKRDL